MLDAPLVVEGRVCGYSIASAGNQLHLLFRDWLVLRVSVGDWKSSGDREIPPSVFRAHMTMDWGP